MRILELFCGTKSFSKEAEKRGHKVFTVDFDKKFNPDLCIDILDLDISMIPKEFRRPDVFWASPPCTEYSKAKSQGKRNLEYADSVVKKTLELRNKIKAKIWIIENPQTGLLKDRGLMDGLLFIDVSYCKYGYPYRKQTRFWTNLKFNGKTCNKDCDFMVDGIKGKRHIGSAGCGGVGQGHKISYSNRSYKQIEKYSLPPKLCLEIIKAIECSLNLNNTKEVENAESN